MDLLTLLMITNFILLLVGFFSRRATRMTYTESIIARQISGYTLILLAGIVIGLLLLQKHHAAQIAGMMINLFLFVMLIIYLMRILVIRIRSGR